MAKKKIENLSFEELLSELEDIVHKLEQGNLSLEDSMTFFERGLKLSHLSQNKLQDAEQKIKILMKDQSGNEALEDFHLSESPNS